MTDTRLVDADELTADLHATSGRTVRVRLPFSGEVGHDLPHSSVDDVADAAAAGRAAQRAWWEAGPSHRRAVLLRAHDLLLQRRGELLDLVQLETGKTRGQAFEEVFQGASVTRYSALSTHRAVASERRRAGIPGVIRTEVTYRPKGLVGVITPWNYPLSLALMDAVPALATGNAVLQKTDDQATLSVLAARRAFLDAGVPEEVWSVVTGAGDTIGSAVVDSADYVCFTGSTETGRRVAERAARGLTGASLELGGKNPLIVLDDVDPARAARDTAYAAFAAMGQLCVSIERVYVLRGVADQYLDELAAVTGGLRQGGALDYSTDVGALATPAQLDRVAAHVDDAVAKGATVLAGGHPRPDLGPLFYAPTVLTDLRETMTCAREETFGAVLGVTVVDSEEEAVERANDSSYGLNAAVFSSDRRRARRLARHLHAGSVNINEGYRATFASVDAPMGGLGQSGLGRRNGIEGLRRFVEPVTIAEATGLLQLPRTGEEFERMTGPMLLLLRGLKGARRR